MRKRVIILGATGSIGRSTLDVVRAHPEEFQIVGLSAHSDAAALKSLTQEFTHAVLALEAPKGNHDLFSFSGTGSSAALVSSVESDIVVNGIAGAAGLLPSYAAVCAGVDLALANKETVVMAWPVIKETAERNGARVIPVDSEHSAIFHLTEAHGRANLDEIILTASGGPFLDWPLDKLNNVSVSDALAHPTWAMGGKITIDSASLANKGLEVIEASRLFAIDVSHVQVLIHPQSLVHSLVRLQDGSLYAQISKPDMRLPIHNALFWPRITHCPFGRLDLTGAMLRFAAPDSTKFPMLPLAYEAARLSGLYPAAYNAANEQAVAAFFSGAIGFMEIPVIVKAAMDSDWAEEDRSIEVILDGDRRARAVAEKAITAVTEGRT